MYVTCVARKASKKHLSICVHCQGILCKEPAVSLPPILIRITDKDEGFRGPHFATMGETAIWPRVLETEADGTLDLNRQHEAHWYSCDGRCDVLKFHPVIEPSWALRPRLLAAAGFSITSTTSNGGSEAPQNPQEIQTKKWMQVKLKLDLLGFRGLEPQTQTGRGAPSISVSPFWSTKEIEGAVGELGKGTAQGIAQNIPVSSDQRGTCQGRVECQTERFEDQMSGLVAFRSKNLGENTGDNGSLKDESESEGLLFSAIGCI